MPGEFESVLKENETSDESASDQPGFTHSHTRTLDSGLGIEPTFEASPGEYEIKRRESSAAVKDTQPVGFWHEEMVTVRLHVLKLWARTSKS